MLRHFASLPGLTLLLGLAFVPAAHAQTRFSLQIGPVGPVYEAPGPPPGYVWQQGHYAWTGFDYRWVPGGWVRSCEGRRDWARERWERDHSDFHRAWGEWERDRDWDRYRDRSGDRDHDRRYWDPDDRDRRR